MIFFTFWRKQILLSAREINNFLYLGSPKQATVIRKKRERRKRILGPEYQLIDISGIEFGKKSLAGNPLIKVGIEGTGYTYTQRDPSKKWLGQLWQCTVSETSSKNRCPASIWEEFGDDNEPKKFHLKNPPAHRCPKKPKEGNLYSIF